MRFDTPAFGDTEVPFTPLGERFAAAKAAASRTRSGRRRALPGLLTVGDAAGGSLLTTTSVGATWDAIQACPLE